MPKVPRCIHCGRTIPKKTTCHYIPVERNIRTKADVQRLYNQQVVSIARGGGDNGDEFIRRVGLWDGVTYESYGQSYFCTKDCGWKFALREAARRAQEGI